MSGEFHRNVLIEASAGTGKTQALAQRLIELRRGGVRPQGIVALTFSRAAAGEIFERFVMLLAADAAENPRDEALLRDVIASQHLGAVGTLDGFLLRIVCAFPQELGMKGDVRIMDGYEASCERARVSFSVLRRTDAESRGAFAAAFALANGGENVRAMARRFGDFIDVWHGLYLSHPSRSAWGDAASVPGVPAAVAEFGEDVLASAADAIEASPPTPDAGRWAEFASCVRSFRGTMGPEWKKGYAARLLEADDVFSGATIEFSYGRKSVTVAGEGALLVRRALLAAAGYALRRSLETARGVYSLMERFERTYDLSVRSRGRLVFDDVPRLISSLDPRARESLEYRLDMRLSAWALDEFQDTSREQWEAIRGLVSAARQSGGEKSVFIVGDSKQAIYGWRHGDVGIFLDEKSGGQYDVRELVTSWRFAPAVAKAVNGVFRDGGRLTSEFPAWHSPEHVVAEPNADRRGFVQVVDPGCASAGDFIEHVRNAVAAVDPAGRGISAAILVRSNAFGELLAEELRRRGVEGVVWEGESSVLETPALSAFVDLVSIADHPGDAHCYRHFLTTPLCRAKYPDGAPSAAEMSGEFARAFADRGLVRTFRELRSLLAMDPAEAWSEYTEERFTDMLRSASAFEASASAGTRLSDFEAYLASAKVRNVAEPGKVKVMTIHRSKGLGFDYVILPLYEKEGLRSHPSGPLAAEGWVLPDPGPLAAKAFAAVQKARRGREERAEQEELCAYYVAMTRAKRAMTVILHRSGDSLRFSDIVRSSLAAETGDRDWYLDFAADAAPAGAEPARSAPAPARGPRETVLRRMPSRTFHSGMSAGALFAASEARRDAMARGTRMHESFEKIEWLDAASATTDLERALVRPSPDAALWREKPYEIFSGGAWESGRFDRVVFTGRGAERRAAIYDFKTNAMLSGEDSAAFAARMRRVYARQMRSYRSALASLSGIDPERISAALLLVATGSVEWMFPSRDEAAAGNPDQRGVRR